MKQNSLTIVENHEIKLCPQKTRSCIKLTISENCLLVPTYLNDYKVDNYAESICPYFIFTPFAFVVRNLRLCVL